jgi:glycosyltransferase involved in cell wall biosynthesis
VSVVLETASADPANDITLADCLAALARQSYPRELIEVIVVDGGKVPGLARVVRGVFADAMVLPLPGGSKFEQKNLGSEAASGEIVAFVDADCAPPADWLRTIVAELSIAPPDVAGVQGITELTRGVLSREMSALLYGVRYDRRRRSAGRLVTDNCAFRRPVLRRFGFEHPHFSTVADTLLLRRLDRAGYRLLLCEGLRMTHSYPGLTGAGLRWFLARAWGVGYYMVRARRLEAELRGSALVRAAGLGWPLLALAKAGADLRQVWENRPRVGARLLAALPVVVVYELTLFAGGLAALLRRPPPRWA